MMESLSDLLKQMPIAAGVADIEEKKRQLLARPEVKQLLGEYPELTDDVLKLYLPRLYHYVTELDHCAACPGLERCPNDFPGYYTRLSVTSTGGITQLNDHKVACNHYIAKQSEDQLRKKIRSFYVDEQLLHRHYQLSEIAALDPERQSAVLRIASYIKNTKEESLPSKGLYLVGDFGTGKTFLIGYLLTELAKLGYTGVIVFMPDFAEDLKSMFGDPQRLKDTIEIMKHTDVLVFDDIGAENMNPWLRDHVLGSILNYRMNRKPTFYTSNHDLERLQQHFSFTSKDGEEADRGRRIMERIRPFVDVVAVGGTNKRGMVTR